MLNMKLTMANAVNWVACCKEFRGLWRSRCIENDGTTTEGWSATFVHKDDYAETPYCDGPFEALVKMEEILRQAPRPGDGDDEEL